MKKCKDYKDKQMSSKVAHFAEGGKVARNPVSRAETWIRDGVSPADVKSMSKEAYKRGDSNAGYMLDKASTDHKFSKINKKFKPYGGLVSEVPRYKEDEK